MHWATHLTGRVRERWGEAYPAVHLKRLDSACSAAPARAPPPRCSQQLRAVRRWAGARRNAANREGGTCLPALEASNACQSVMLSTTTGTPSRLQTERGCESHTGLRHSGPSFALHCTQRRTVGSSGGCGETASVCRSRRAPGCSLATARRTPSVRRNFEQASHGGTELPGGRAQELIQASARPVSRSRTSMRLWKYMVSRDATRVTPEEPIISSKVGQRKISYPRCRARKTGSGFGG